ncbi:MAG: 2-C-methyl-D-erythritol 2,4-cyclodiphosphate synthase [Candidatus Theseobacter exili]|nr:2-C-methyl-D-erythritol 2,4-cyclodiphosphate synthase [Candidatus Theseobacter exili]
MGNRIGIGYDVHRFTEERPLILGGVRIPYKKGLEGHSDADVLAHAVADAVLGAASAGDIGQHFPDNDPGFSGADSLVLLSRTVEIAAEKGFKIVNVDSTVVLQEPKISNYTKEMTSNLAQSLKIDPERVNVKATTSEGMGFCGRSEGAAAWAVCLIEEI